MEKLNYEDVACSSPTSVSSGYCSQWMSPNNSGFSKQPVSERIESEFESDSGVNEKLLHEFHCDRPKTHRNWSNLFPSFVEGAKRKLTSAQQRRKSVHNELGVLQCPLFRSNSTSLPLSQHFVQSSSSDFYPSQRMKFPVKRHLLTSGDAINSDKLLTSVSGSTSWSLAKKHSKKPKKCCAALCAYKVRYLTVSICRLPAGIKFTNVKNIGNSLCWFQSSTQILDSTVRPRHKRTKNDFKQLHSNSDKTRLQLNSDHKQLQSCSYLKQLSSQSFKCNKSKSYVKQAELSHDKKQLAFIGVEGLLQAKSNIKHLKSKKCKNSLHEAEIGEEYHDFTEGKSSCAVIQNSRSALVKSKSLESYKCNAEQMQSDSFTKTKSQNVGSLHKISNFNRCHKKRCNHEQCSVKVKHTTHGSTVHESPVSHHVSTSDFHSFNGKLESCTCDFCHPGVFSSVKHHRKCNNTSENLTAEKHHTHQKAKCKLRGKSEYRHQQGHWKPLLGKFVFPTSRHTQTLQNSICSPKHQRSSTNPETYANKVLTNETERILSHRNLSYLSDIHNKLPQCYTESRVKKACRNLFDTFLREIPSTSQENLAEETTSQPKMSAIQNSGNSQVLKSVNSGQNLVLLQPSETSVQLRTENSGTEPFERNARLLDTNVDMYSDISDDVLPDAVSTTYDMFSDISDCITADIPVKESSFGHKLSDIDRNLLPDNGVLWTNDLHSLWLSGQCFTLPASNMSLELIEVNAIESHKENNKETLLSQEDSGNNEYEDVSNCQEPCSTVIQNNMPVCNNICHTEIKTNSSSHMRPCSFMVTAISKGPCLVLEEDESSCMSCSCANYIQGESAFGLQHSVECPDKSFICTEPCCLLKAQMGLLIAKEIVRVQNESNTYEHSPSEVPDKVLASKTPCSVESQNGVSTTDKETVSFQVQNELLALGSKNILETIHTSDKFRSNNIRQEESTYRRPYEFGVYGEEQVTEIPCSRESLVVQEPFSGERPLVSEMCVAEDRHLILEGSKEGSLVSDAPYLKEGCFTSRGSCCKVGLLVLEVISEDSCSREELQISEEPCKDRPLVSDEPISSNRHLISKRSNSSDMLQIESTGPREGVSCVQEVKYLAAGASCISETTNVSLNLEDLFSMVRQGPPEGFAKHLTCEALLSCAHTMQEGTPVVSESNNTQENSLLAQTPCIATLHKKLCKICIPKALLLTSEDSSSKDSHEPEINGINSNQLDTSSTSESFLTKFHEFTNVWRPSTATKYESDRNNTDQDNDVDSLDETCNECISDAKGTSSFTSQVTMPCFSVKAKTDSYQQEYQLQMLENQQKTHKNWKLLVSVKDDPESGGRCGRRKGASGRRLQKRNNISSTNKARHQPKRFCPVTRNTEQTEPEPSNDLRVMQQDFWNVDLACQSNFSVEGVMANFQNMVLNGDPSILSLFVEQADTWLSLENSETTIDLADLGHSDLESTAPFASDTLTSDNATSNVVPLQSKLLNSACAMPVPQPESIVPPGLTLNSIDAQTVTLLSENRSNVEALNMLCSDTGKTLKTVVPGFAEVSELDAEMLQYLLSVFPQSGPVGVSPGISYIPSNEIVTNPDVNRGIIYVLNHSRCGTPLLDCSQILNCHPVLECNRPNTGSQCQVEGPVLILTNSNNISARANYPESTKHSDTGLCIDQNSSTTMRPVLFEGDFQPAKNNCLLMDFGEFRANNIASASDLEQGFMVDVVQADGGLLSEERNVLDSQQESTNTLMLEKNCQISNDTESSSEARSENYSDDHTHQNAAERGCSVAVLVEKVSELSRNDECSKTLLTKGLLQSDSLIVSNLQNDHSIEANQSRSAMSTADKLLSSQNCCKEHSAHNCKVCVSVSGNSVMYVDRQGTSGFEYRNEVPSGEPNAGEDSSSDESDPFELTCEDAGDNAAMFLEEAAEDYCSGDVIMLCCNYSLHSCQANDSETLTAHLDVAMSSSQEQHASHGGDDASKDPGVPADILLLSGQGFVEKGDQKSEHLVNGIQSSSEGGNPKSADLGNDKGSKRSSEDREIVIEEFNKNYQEAIQTCLKDDNNISLKEGCQVLSSSSREEEATIKVAYSNSAIRRAANQSDRSPNWRRKVLHPHDSVFILADSLALERNRNIKTKLKKSKPTDRAKGKESETIRPKSRLMSLAAQDSVPGNAHKLRGKLKLAEINVCETKLKKSTTIRKSKRKALYAVESQGLHVAAPNRLNHKGNCHKIRHAVCSDGVTEQSYSMSNEQTKGNLKESSEKVRSYSHVQTVEPTKDNSCTKDAMTLKQTQNGIKLRIVKVCSGLWQAQSSTDPVTQQCCNRKGKSVATASNEDSTVLSENLSSCQNGIYISDDSNTDSLDCFCVDDESCLANNRLDSAERTIVNKVTSPLPTSALHRFGCKCLSCAEQQFLYGRDNTVSLFTDISLTQGLMRYKQSKPARSPSQVCSIVPVSQSPVVIDDLDGSNSDMPIIIL